MEQAITSYDYIYKAIINCERSIKLLKDAGSDTTDLENKLMLLKLQVDMYDEGGELLYKESLID